MIELIGNFVLFTIAGIFVFLWHSVLWTIGLCCIRFYAGGYHANTHMTCLIISTINAFIFSGFIKFIYIPPLVLFVFHGISILILLFVAPVGSAQKPLTDKTRKVRKKGYG